MNNMHDILNKMNLLEGWGADKQRKNVEEVTQQLNERNMSRAAKGHEKYGKEGMQALAKAGREGKDLDKVRAKYDKYDESVREGAHSQDAMKLNPDFKKVGAKPTVADKIKAGVKKVADFVAPGDEELVRRLEKSSGGKRPTNESAKPDYIDLDRDGDKKESMKKAAADAKKKKSVKENIRLVKEAKQGNRAVQIYHDREYNEFTVCLSQDGKTQKFFTENSNEAAARARSWLSEGRGSKPDYIDLDRDGDKSEPMKKAAQDAKHKFKKTMDEADVEEGNRFTGNLMKARAAGKKQADLDGDGDMEPVKEATKEIPGGRRHTAEPGGYGRKSDDDAPKVATKKGRGRPKKGSDSETGEVMRPDFSAFGVGGKVNLPKHKGAVTRHKMVGEGEHDDVDAAIAMLKKAGYTVSKNKRELDEKAESENQAIAARIALQHKKAGTKPKAGTASAEMAKMSKTDLKDFTKAKPGAPKKVDEEDTDTRDQRAEKAGRKVTKDIEYDERVKDQDHGKKRGAQDARAEKAGKRVAKDIEHDEKVDETTVSGSVAPAADAPKGNKGGIQFGKGIYEAQLAEGFEKQIGKIMKESVNVTVNANSEGSNTVTVTGKDVETDTLVNLLKMAGMNSAPEAVYKPVDMETPAAPDSGADMMAGMLNTLDGIGNDTAVPEAAVCEMCGAHEGMHEAGCSKQMAVEGELANSGDNTETMSTDYMVNKLSGGLNGPKKQVNPNNMGDNPLAMPSLGKTAHSLSLGAGAETVKENTESKLWKLFKEYSTK